MTDEERAAEERAAEERTALRDVLWKMYSENCTQARHHETQRALVASGFLAIATAVIGIITFDKGLTDRDIPLALLIIALGAFGAIFSAKHYERAQLHTKRGREDRDALDKLLPGSPLKSLRDKADKKNKEDFPTLTQLNLFKFWIGINLAVSAVGACLAAMAWWFPIAPKP